MFHIGQITLIGAVLAAVGLGAAPVAADHLNRTYVKQGISIHMGLMSTRELRQRIRNFPERYAMHARSGVPRGRHMFHVNVVLFDEATGARITDAAVTARVAPLGLAGSRLRLDPMLTAGVVEYCNYFEIRPHERYVIDLAIRLPGRDAPIEIRNDDVEVY